VGGKGVYPPAAVAALLAGWGGVTPSRRSSCNQFQGGGGIPPPVRSSSWEGGIPPPRRAGDIILTYLNACQCLLRHLSSLPRPIQAGSPAHIFSLSSLSLIMSFHRCLRIQCYSPRRIPSSPVTIWKWRANRELAQNYLPDWGLEQRTCVKTQET